MYTVLVGLSGSASNPQKAWQSVRFIEQKGTPALVITNPASSNIMQPIIEVQGYSPVRLASLTYSVSNAVGVISNQPAFVTQQSYNPVTQLLETNAFQAFDVGVANGTNLLTFYAIDLAGNATTTNFTFNLNYASKTNPPTVNVFWPLNGESVSGSGFTLRGSLGDFTASLTAQFVDADGNTNIVSAVVERNGDYWVENAALAPGSNYVTLTAVDVVSNTTTTNLVITNVVSGGAPVLTVADFTSQLGGAQHNVLGTITGTVSLSGYTVWVNGSNAVISGTNWTATNVCVGPGGTAVMDVQAIPNSDDGGAGTGSTGSGDGTPVNHTAADAVAAELQIDQPPFLYVSEHHQSETDSEVLHWPAYDATETTVNTYSEDAVYYGGGTVTSADTVNWINGSPNSTNVAAESWSSDFGPATLTLTIDGDESSLGTIWTWDNPLGTDYSSLPGWKTQARGWSSRAMTMPARYGMGWDRLRRQWRRWPGGENRAARTLPSITQVQRCTLPMACCPWATL